MKVSHQSGRSNFANHRAKNFGIAMRLVVCLTVAALSSLAMPNLAYGRDLPVVRPAMDCRDLAGLDIYPEGGSPARINSATLERSADGIPRCRVEGYVAPQVRFELRLPTENWYQRFMYSGCGGFCGRVDFRVRAAEGCSAVENGEFAMVASDLGHSTPEGNADTIWAAGNRQGKIDYGYRGVHVVTLASKAIIEIFYGQAPAYSYFNGCSDGGREGMMEVQRYPEDFDGVIAGAPVMNNTANNTIFHAWSARHLFRADGSPVFSEKDLRVLHAGALAACDLAGDGIRDGLVSDPFSCAFDPEVLLCEAGDSGECLTGEQVAAARALYSGPIDSSGRRLFFGRPIGSELAWGGPNPVAYAAAFVRHMSEDEPREFDLDTFGFEPEDLRRYNSLASIFNATDTDISAFRDAGGKLIMWHGLADPGVPAEGTLHYYNAVRERLGTSTDDFLTMYLLPGVGHCGGGHGPDRINLVNAIMAWVEDGVAPGAIETVRREYGRVVQSRPVYPYPSVATYVGHGDPLDRTSFGSSTGN